MVEHGVKDLQQKNCQLRTAGENPIFFRALNGGLLHMNPDATNLFQAAESEKPAFSSFIKDSFGKIIVLPSTPRRYVGCSGDGLVLLGLLLAHIGNVKEIRSFFCPRDTELQDLRIHREMLGLIISYECPEVFSNSGVSGLNISLNYIYKFIGKNS